jgi:hypothetical protein
VFQRTLQRNEIYSALNRFAHRPPTYPTVVKETRTSATRFQQLRFHYFFFDHFILFYFRSNPSVSVVTDQHRVKSTDSSQD